MDAMEGVLKESSEYDGVNRDGNVGLGSEFIILIILLLKQLSKLAEFVNNCDMQWRINIFLVYV